MDSVSIAEAGADLSALFERVEAGETVTITRMGREVARMSPARPPRQKIDVEALGAHTHSMPMQDTDAGRFMRKMRDEARY
jgi:prevent-host-death family protein